MIVKPEHMDFSGKNIIMIISGLPGVGKTTLALSAPGVVLIDADEGMARVNPAHRRDSSLVKTYEDVLADIERMKGAYQTVVIDTAGALIDLMKDWAARTDRSVYSKNGNVDGRKVFGVVKSEFLRLSGELRRSFNVIYLFHASKERDGDETFYDIICEGSARTLVWQPADLGAYLHITGGERYLGFTPTANYNAKSAYGIRGLVRVPELKDGEPNDFLTRLFAQVKANLAQESEAGRAERAAYEAAMEAGRGIIEGVSGIDDIQTATEQIKALPHALTSRAELQTLLKSRLASLGITYNRERRAYEQTSAE